MKYIVYCRKSSEDSRKQYQSLDTQERIIRDLVKSENLTVIKYLRESKSARFSGCRPLFAEMIALIADGKADGILTYHVDRLARNLKDSGEITELMDKKKLIEVKTPNDSYRTSSDLLKMGINNVIAENYSRELSEKVRSGNESKLKKGEYPSCAPIGYLNVRNGIIPDPDRSFFIKEIFELYNSGQCSIGGIVKLMANQGLRSRKNCKLHKSSIERILKNPEYYGVIQRKGLLYEGKHEPLITKALFDTVQEQLAVKTHVKDQTLSFLYRGYLTCQNCGCKLTASLKKGKYSYYYCTNGKGQCNQHKHYLNDSQINSLVLNLLQQFIPDRTLLDLSFNRYVFEMRKTSTKQEKIQTSLASQVALLEKKLEKLEDMYLEDRITAQRYDEKKREIQNELTELKLSFKTHKAGNTEPTLELLKRFKDRVKSLWQLYEEGNNEVRKDILQSLLWNCEIKDKEIVSSRYKKPYNYMLKFQETNDLTILSGRQDSNLRPLAPHASILAI